MPNIIDIFIYFIAFIIMMPLLPTWVLYKIVHNKTRHHWQAIHISIDWTATLYVLAVLSLFNMMFKQLFLGIILIILLLVLTFIIIYQWKENKEIVFSRAIKILWRFIFLLFFVLYIILILIGIVFSVIF